MDLCGAIYMFLLINRQPLIMGYFVSTLSLDKTFQSRTIIFSDKLYMENSLVLVHISRRFSFEACL